MKRLLKNKLILSFVAVLLVSTLVLTTTGASWMQTTIYAITGYFQNLNAPTGRGATIVVAASDATATEKAQADYVCDGTADDVQIQAAIDALPDVGGSIKLTTGLYSISATLKPKNVADFQILIEGAYPAGVTADVPAGVTELQLANGANCDMFAPQGVTRTFLFLKNLVLDGNKANNASGNGITANQFLNVGGWYNGGLDGLLIQNFADSGYYGATYPVMLSATRTHIANNNDYGIYLMNGEGCHIGYGANDVWSEGNGLANIYLSAVTNSFIDVASEGGSQYGVYLATIGSSSIRIWASGSNWHGVRAVSLSYDDITLFVKGCGLDFTGCPDNASYNGQVYFLNNDYCSLNVNIRSTGTPANTNGLVNKGNTYSNIRGVVTASGYALNMQNSTEAANLDISLNLSGTSGAVTWFGAPSLQYYPSPQNIVLHDCEGFIAPGETRIVSGKINTLTQDAFNSLDNPFGQAVRVLDLQIYVSTGATATAPNIDCGIGNSATTDYATLFDDLPGETVGFYTSTIATPGTQTVPQLWGSGAGNRYLNMSIKDAAATGMVATYTVTVMGN